MPTSTMMEHARKRWKGRRDLSERLIQDDSWEVREADPTGEEPEEKRRGKAERSHWAAPGQAVSEPGYCATYARMCRQLVGMNAASESSDASLEVFKLLLHRCQQEFLNNLKPGGWGGSHGDRGSPPSARSYKTRWRALQAKDAEGLSKTHSYASASCCPPVGNYWMDQYFRSLNFFIQEGEVSNRCWKDPDCWKPSSAMGRSSWQRRFSDILMDEGIIRDTSSWWQWPILLKDPSSHGGSSATLNSVILGPLTALSPL